MTNVPADIFAEPEVDPDTLANLGPLRPLAGTWRAVKGADTSPKDTGPETKTYVEQVLLEPIDGQTNGPQLFYGLRYHKHIINPQEKITFHDQVGYWLWEPKTGLIVQTLTIPRGQCVLATGTAKADDRRFFVEAVRGNTTNGIVSQSFLEDNFRTDRYRCEIIVNDDDSWTYTLDTTLMVRGQESPFDHHDTNTLLRIAAAAPNPFEVASRGGGKGDRGERT